MTVDVQPRISGPWSKRLDGSVVEPVATAAMRTAVGSMRFDLPRASGIPINETTAATSRYPLKVKWAGGNQLDGARFPIPAKPKLEDHTKDFHLLCWDRQSGEVFEAIAYQAKTGDGFWDRLLGSNVHRAAKAAKFRTDVPWKPLDPSKQSSVVAGFPLSNLLLAPTQLDHALAVCVPQNRVAGLKIGPTGGASDCDGWVNDPTLGYVRIGQRLRLRADVDMSGWGPAARAIGICMQVFGIVVVMSGNPKVNMLKFVVLENAFLGYSSASLAGLNTITGDALEAVRL